MGKRLFAIADEKLTPKSTDRGESSTVLAFTFGKANSIMFEFKLGFHVSIFFVLLFIPRITLAICKIMHYNLRVSAQNSTSLEKFDVAD